MVNITTKNQTVEIRINEWQSP